jgi:predicted nucleotidyltransferase
VTRYHSYHYLGFADTQWKLFEKQIPPRVKPLLYLYRVLLTGIHLMQTGEVEANLVRLNENAKLPYLDDLILQKTNGTEHTELSEVDVSFHQGEYQRLRRELQEAHEDSKLPETPGCAAALNDLLIRLRLGESH